MNPPLKLLAKDEEDLSVISAHLQDSLVVFADMDFLSEEQRFLLVVSRFRWETCTPIKSGPKPYLRVHSGLCFDNVTDVKLRNLDRKDRSRVLELLAIRAGQGFIDLLFAERGRVRLEVRSILCHLQDLDEPWPTPWRPRHPVTEED